MKNYYQRQFPNYKIENIDVNEIVEQTGILKDNSVLNRRYQIWGDKYENYKLNDTIYDNEYNYPIMIYKDDFGYHIEDGMHRMIALKNAGYDKAEVLVYKGK